jgi:hypothetical protein
MSWGKWEMGKGVLLEMEKGKRSRKWRKGKQEERRELLKRFRKSVCA